MSRPRLLYCAPLMPALTGNGLAMRAGSVLRALATRYRVSLLVVPLYPSPAGALPAELAACCRQVVVTPVGGSVPAPTASAEPSAVARSRLLGLPWAQRSAVGAGFADEPFDVVHVFRLATVEQVRPWLGAASARPARHLDLDDVELTTRRRIADLHALTGRPDLAATERAAAERALAAEVDAMRDFDRVYVCSDGDRAALEARQLNGAQARIEVLPNALSVPALLPPPSLAGPFTFLFVGTLGYVPNEDAILTFCREVLPRLRRMAPLPFRIAVVGTGASPAVESLTAIPEVELLGAVPDIADCYAQANAAIVPLRAGGGTRIKVLEAFAYRRPVVATTIGAEGIDARHGEHLLIADDPADFARQCARLLVSADLGARLSDRAESLFRQRYSLDALTRRVQALP